VEFISSPVGGHQTPKKVLSKQYIARRRRRIVTGALGAFALGCIVAAFVLVGIPMPPGPSTEASPVVSNELDSVVRTESAAKDDRPVYLHSVVPGGVRSPEEIAAVIQRDGVVAAHYEGINPQLMRNERLQTPLLAHVSYRLGNKVYWTRKPVLLPANEPVMTDGTTTIRERCGNIISMDPLAPVSDEEPALPSFDQTISPVGFASQKMNMAPPSIRVGASAPVPMAIPGQSPGSAGSFGSIPSFSGTPGSPSSSSGNGGSPPPSTRSVDPPTYPPTDPPVHPPTDPPTHPPTDPPTDPPSDPPSDPPTDPPTSTPTPADVPLPVPEPSTLTLFALAGAAGLAHQLRKRARTRGRN